jgi:hypothetical protein
MSVQAWFSHNDVEVEPGASTVITLRVVNLGANTESFALTPSGLAAPWATVRPAHVTMFGGSEELIEVEIRPPRLSSTTAGPTALGVRIVSQGEPDHVDNVETTLHIEATHDRSIHVLQPAVRSRRRALFEFLVENQGNTQASCRLHLIDPTHRLDGDFDPPAVGVEPGGSSLVRVKVRATRRQWQRRSRSIPFRIEADQLGAETAAGVATLVQAPVLPEQLWSRLGAIVAVAGLVVAAWFAVLRPEIRRVADQAVRAHPVVVTVPVTAAAPASGQPAVVPTPAVASTTPASAAVAPTTTAVVPEPLALSLPTGAAVGQKATQTYTVPDGKTLQVTDILVQNPFGDSGTVSLQIGTTPFDWNLDNLAGVDAKPAFVTPIQLQPGDVITLAVTCSRVIRQGSAQCSPNVLLSGRLLPATARPAVATSSSTTTSTG